VRGGVKKFEDDPLGQILQGSSSRKYKGRVAEKPGGVCLK